MTFASQIGVFDSGVGGLTVLREIASRFPQLRMLYVADQAHLPYGGRPLDEVRGFAEGISRFLVDQGCGGIVMACNISSATALAGVRAAFSNTPALGMIAPAARAVHAAGIRKVGVLATAGTVASGAYVREIGAIAPQVEIIQVACPDLVPIVEAGESDSSRATNACVEYLSPILSGGCTTIVLGCTHYPLLSRSLQLAAAALGHPNVQLIDPAREVAAELGRHLQTGTGPKARHLFVTTGSATDFARQAAGLMPSVQFDVCSAAWSAEGRLTLQSPTANIT